MIELRCEYLSVQSIWLYVIITYQFQSESTLYEFQSESTLYSLPECQGTPCSKQAPYLTFKWQQLDSNPQPLSS